MPYYKDINLLFVHIPKTGGTSLEYFLQNKYKQTLLSSFTNDILPDPEYRKISLQHQTYNTIFKYRDILDINFESIKIISIVRNPYHRIISDLLFLGLINKDDNQTVVYNVIKDYLYKDCYDNHNIPQYKFITDDNEMLIPTIKIFKTETLTQELIEYGFNDYIGSKSTILHNNYLNDESIKLINTFYIKDFELFNYKMIITL